MKNTLSNKIRELLRRIKFSFSTKVVLVYTCLVFIPVALLFTYIISKTITRQRQELIDICSLYMQQNVDSIAQKIDTVNRMETMVFSDNELNLMLAMPENYTDSQIVDITRRKASDFERMLTLEPFNAIRIFTPRTIIPERWPVILRFPRTNLPALKPWEFNYSAKYINDRRNEELSVCATREMLLGKRSIGYLQISYSMKTFFPFLYKRNSTYENDYVFTLGRSGSGSHFFNITNDSIKLTQQELGEKYINHLEKEYFRAANKEVIHCTVYKGKIIIWQKSRELGTIFVHTCSTSVISKAVAGITVVLVLTLSFSAVLLFYLIKFTTEKMMRGVFSVIRGMRKVQLGELGVQISVEGDDEVGQAQKTFNKMTRQLQNQIAQIKKEQQLIAETELKAMQNQINAHFLFNVLETIRMQAVLADEDTIAQTIAVLGKMMHYCLRWRVHFVELSKEIEYIESYIYLLNLRNDYTITLETQVDEKFLHLNIPKMVLQPLVENAFYHAIEGEAKDSVIKVFTKEDGDILYLCVEDFGCGMEEKQIDAILEYLKKESAEEETTGHIGIKNIQQRLFMFYGDGYKIQIESEKGKGTLIKIPVPKGDLSV
ncbi:MAG: sensor histidine kinase [Treponema sp.]|nr:sensor histidine kinase [Treponema sp.]